MDLQTKYDIPEFKKLGQVSPSNIQTFKEEIEILKSLASKNGSLVNYADSWIVDLTQIDPQKIKSSDSLTWAGSASTRANNQRKESSGLKVKKLNNPMDNDMSHNELKEWVPETQIIQYLRIFGDLRKITISSLLPGGWWPSHYDFNYKNGYKINLVITSNPDCKSILWNARKKELVMKSFSEGEIWSINVGMKHTAHNWGHEERIHVLGSYKEFYEKSENADN